MEISFLYNIALTYTYTHTSDCVCEHIFRNMNKTNIMPRNLGIDTYRFLGVKSMWKEFIDF